MICYRTSKIFFSSLFLSLFSFSFLLLLIWSLFFFFCFCPAYVGFFLLFLGFHLPFQFFLHLPNFFCRILTFISFKLVFHEPYMIAKNNHWTDHPDLHKVVAAIQADTPLKLQVKRKQKKGNKSEIRKHKKRIQKRTKRK